jgi:PP-loop family
MLSDFQDKKVRNTGGLELDNPPCNIPPTEAIEKDENTPRSVVFATAHHADDQHETMLLKLIRGAYITNLQPVCKCVLIYVQE